MLEQSETLTSSQRAKIISVSFLLIGLLSLVGWLCWNGNAISLIWQELMSQKRLEYLCTLLLVTVILPGVWVVSLWALVEGVLGRVTPRTVFILELLKAKAPESNPDEKRSRT